MNGAFKILVNKKPLRILRKKKYKKLVNETYSGCSALLIFEK